MATRLCHCGKPRPCSLHPPTPRRSFSNNRAVWQRARTAALYRDKNMCQRCGVEGTTLSPLHVHHWVARRDGGSDALANLVSLCEVCHPLIERGKRSSIF